MSGLFRILLLMWLMLTLVDCLQISNSVSCMS